MKLRFTQFLGVRRPWASGVVGLAAIILLAHSGNASAQTDGFTQLNLGSTLLNDVRTALPESNAANASFADPSYNPNLKLYENS